MKTVDVLLPTKVLTVRPVVRANLQAFERHMVEAQAAWLESGFSTGDAVLNDECWGHLSAIAQMLPHFDNPASAGFDMELLSGDYEQIERLFFGDASAAYEPRSAELAGDANSLDVSLFKGCALYELHRFEPKKKLLEACGLYLERSHAEDSPRKTSQLKGAETQTRTRSRSLSTGSTHRPPSPSGKGSTRKRSTA